MIIVLYDILLSKIQIQVKCRLQINVTPAGSMSGAIAKFGDPSFQLLISHACGSKCKIQQCIEKKRMTLDGLLINNQNKQNCFMI